MMASGSKSPISKSAVEDVTVLEDDTDTNTDTTSTSTNESISGTSDGTKTKRKLPSDKERNFMKGKKQKREQPATTVYLEKLLSIRGTLAKEEIDENSKSVDQWVKKIIKEVKHRNKHAFHRLEVFKTGSNAEGLKVNRPNEFDVMLVLTAELQEVFEVVYDEEAVPAGYAKLLKVGSLSAQKFQVFERFMKGEYLSSRLIMEFFQKEVGEAVKRITDASKGDDLAKLRIKNSFQQNSPAVTVSISDGKKLPISLDLVLSIKINGWPSKGAVAKWGQSESSWPDQATVEKCRGYHHLVAKRPYPPSEQSSDLWRFSFSYAEIKMMNPKKKGIQKECLKMAKVILGSQNLLKKTIKSYHLKTILMNLMMENDNVPGYWSEENLGPRVIDLLTEMKEAVVQKNLSHFFIPSLNLLAYCEDSQIYLTIDKIVESLTKDPKLFCEKVLHEDTYY